MALGNVVALAQTSMKRMLAYSSIGQAGFVMIGIVSGTQDGLSAAVLYLAAYLFMNLGAFSCVILFSLELVLTEFLITQDFTKKILSLH